MCQEIVKWYIVGNSQTNRFVQMVIVLILQLDLGGCQLSTKPLRCKPYICYITTVIAGLLLVDNYSPSSLENYTSTIQNLSILEGGRRASHSMGEGESSFCRIVDTRIQTNKRLTSPEIEEQQPFPATELLNGERCRLVPEPKDSTAVVLYIQHSTTYSAPNIFTASSSSSWWFVSPIWTDRRTKKMDGRRCFYPSPKRLGVLAELLLASGWWGASSLNSHLQTNKTSCVDDARTGNDRLPSCHDHCS